MEAEPEEESICSIEKTSFTFSRSFASASFLISLSHRRTADFCFFTFSGFFGSSVVSPSPSAIAACCCSCRIVSRRALRRCASSLKSAFEPSLFCSLRY